MRRIFLFILCILLLCMSPSHTKADELDDVSTQLQNLKRDLDASQKASKPLETDLNKLRTQLDGIKAKITSIERETIRKQKELDRGEQTFNEQKKLLDLRVFQYYKNAKKAEGSLLDMVSTTNFSQAVRNFFYQKKLADTDKQTIVRIVLYIKDLETRKQKLELEKARLADIKVVVDKQSEFLSGEVSKAKKYQSELSSKIASLTARQQQIIAAKLGSLNLPTSLGAGPLYCTDDRKLDPGFSGFAFFTYGIPHRVGMNQYGALGRAKAGQNYKDILNAYFSGVNFEKKDNMNIKVQGYGEMPLETYLLGIYEMPGSWPLEALKAQVVAARSYARSYTGNGAKEICTTQSCQVYKGGNKGGDWERAVHETEGEVLTSGGEVITAWYASTAGGYTFTSSDVGWNGRSWTKRLQDGSSGYGGFGDLNNNAYDKESPCFYAAQGFRKEYNKSAWLKHEEVADIVNVLMLAKADSGTQSHLSQPDKSNPDGTDTWDTNRVKQELQNRCITPFNSVSDVSVSVDFGVGKTNTVNASGDGGSKSFDGNEFKTFFNLRAPANIQIVGPLFNIEKR